MRSQHNKSMTRLLVRVISGFSMWLVQQWRRQQQLQQRSGVVVAAILIVAVPHAGSGSTSHLVDVKLVLQIDLCDLQLFEILL